MEKSGAPIKIHSPLFTYLRYPQRTPTTGIEVALCDWSEGGVPGYFPSFAGLPTPGYGVKVIESTPTIGWKIEWLLESSDIVCVLERGKVGGRTVQPLERCFFFSFVLCVVRGAAPAPCSSAVPPSV